MPAGVANTGFTASPAALMPCATATLAGVGLVAARDGTAAASITIEPAAATAISAAALS